MPDEKQNAALKSLSRLTSLKNTSNPIASPGDFRKPNTGQLHLDTLTLRLQVIGENAKQIEAVYPRFFWPVLGYDVGYIVRFRDFVSHHYENLDYEVVFDLCKRKLPKFREVRERYLASQ